MAGLLPPEARLQFSECLHPPLGYKLGRLAGTTYSLDFLTALTVPLAVEARATVDRSLMAGKEIEVLAALKRAAARVSIFVEAGNIGQFSKQASRLAALMEGAIHQVQPARGTSFHPKLWAMSFDPLDASGPVLTRLLVLSRNLTQDQSWDVALRLEGEVSAKRHDDNANLCGFIRYLCKASGRPAATLKPLVDALSQTSWSLPAGYDEFEFIAHHPGGRSQWAPRRGKRLAVISPFCDEKGLDRLGQDSGETILVSTDEWLAQLPRPARPSQCLVLSQAAAPEPVDAIVTPSAFSETASGLHAKIYLVEDGRKRSLTIASGNATGAGLSAGKNVEVFATLSGRGDKAGRIGLWEDEGLLGRKGWGRLLVPWIPRELTTDESSKITAERALWNYRQAVCEAAPELSCKPMDAGYELVLGFQGALSTPSAIQGLRASLATRQDWRAWTGSPLGLGPVDLHELSLFVAFKVTHVDGLEDTFVAKAAGIGFPDAGDRFDAALAQVIDGPEGFLRFASAVLDPVLGQGSGRGGTGGPGTGSSGGQAPPPMLETMLDAYLAEDGTARIKVLGEVVDVARRTKPSWLTPEFEDLWKAFQQATGRGRP